MASNEMDFTRLVDWLEGRLPPAEATALAHAVQTAIDQGNGELKRTVEWIRAFRVLSHQPILAEPPAEARSKVHELIRRRAPAAPLSAAPLSNLLRRMIATLVPANSQDMAGAHTRGNTSGSLRQLTYASDMADIIINILPQPRAPQASLQGLVLPLASLDLNNVVVQLLHDGIEVGITFTNDLGEFGFEALPFGSYMLVLGTAQADIEVGPVTLNA